MIEDLIFGFVLISAGVGGACILVAICAVLVIAARVIWRAVNAY
jgi:hypothetical protein